MRQIKNMKKFILVPLMVFIACNTFSQNMPKEGYTSFGFNITGLANVALSNYGSTLLTGEEISDPLFILPGTFVVDDLVPQNVLLLKRYYSGGLASRLSIGINSIGSKNTIADSTGFFEGYSTSETKISAMSIGLGIGMEKHIATNATKVDPYVAADLNFAYLGKIKYANTNEYSDTTIATTTSYEVNYPGGLGLGLNLITGFNYFFSDNISIGAEAGIGFNFISMGGDYESTTTTTSTPGSSDTITDDGTYKSTNSGIQVGSYGGINLTIYW